MIGKLHVGNLSWRTTEDTLRDMFEGVGPLGQVTIIHDRETGKPKGFGFVTFQSEKDAKRAMSLDGARLDGRTLRVAPAANRSEAAHGNSTANRPREFTAEVIIRPTRSTV